MALLRDMLDKALKERDTAARERDNWRALCEAAGEDYLSTRAENEKLRAELVKAQKDALRYRCLRDKHEYNVDASNIVHEVSGAGRDAAIDDAMSRERK